MTGRRCAWCGERLPSYVRSDRLTCSERCKKARQRRRRDQLALGLETSIAVVPAVAIAGGEQ